MKLIILCSLVATALAAPAAQSLTFNDDGSYRFYYETGQEGGSHSRSEVRHPDGVVIGKYSYQDPDGDIREVNYRADESGFVAQGDVGVKGAPKGQFPAVEEEQPQEESPVTTVTPEEIQAAPEDPQPKAEATTNVESHHDEDHKDDDMQDLAFDETAPDDPPEAFPPGFFLQKFQGLRRLPEPTPKEEKKPATTESPEQDKSVQPEATESDDVKKDEESSKTTEVKSAEQNIFGSLKPFQGLSPQEWSTAMFHQPVYVFSYNQPDSYGYHYFF